MWSDDLEQIVPLCSEFEEKLMKLVWRTRNFATSSVTTDSTVPSTATSNVNLTEKAQGSLVTEAVVSLVEKAPIDPPKRRFWNWSWKATKKAPAPAVTDPEKASPTKRSRPIRLFAPVYGGVAIGLSLCV